MEFELGDVTPRTMVMLTGDQIASARRLAGIRSQADLAIAAGLSRPTIERAEGARGFLTSLGMEAMAKIVVALERAGVEFSATPDGVTMRKLSA